MEMRCCRTEVPQESPAVHIVQQAQPDRGTFLPAVSAQCRQFPPGSLSAGNKPGGTGPPGGSIRVPQLVASYIWRRLPALGTNMAILPHL